MGAADKFVFGRIPAALLSLGLTLACTTIDTHTPPPADWPDLEVLEHFVSHATMRDRCSKYTSWYTSPEACMEVNFAAGTCELWFSADFPPQQFILEHERLHCTGHDHQGDLVLAAAWTLYKAEVASAAIIAADAARVLTR